MTEPLHYARDGKVWKRSVETKHDDGSSSFTLEFPVCGMTEIVGGDGAESIAGLMNLGEEAQTRPTEDALVAALEEMGELVDAVSAAGITSAEDASLLMRASVCARALIAKHKGTG